MFYIYIYSTGWHLTNISDLLQSNYLHIYLIIKEIAFDYLNMLYIVIMLYILYILR